MGRAVTPWRCSLPSSVRRRARSKPPDRHSCIGQAPTVPARTTVIYGQASFPFMAHAAAAVSTVLPDDLLTALPGQDHNVDSAALGPALIEFFDSLSTDRLGLSPVSPC